MNKVTTYPSNKSIAIPAFFIGRSMRGHNSVVYFSFLVGEAKKDFINFIMFVEFLVQLKQTEPFYIHISEPELFDVTLKELDVFRGLALIEWEYDGCPDTWGNKWDRYFRDDAIRLLDKISVTLLDHQIIIP